MAELTPLQVATLERLISHGFTMVAFPLYANSVGVRKGEYATLLEPLPGDGFRLLGEPCALVDGSLSVRVTHEGRSWFVWKDKRIEATTERLAYLREFTCELKSLLEPHA